jgi:hypothetical protein
MAVSPRKQKLLHSVDFGQLEHSTGSRPVMRYSTAVDDFSLAMNPSMISRFDPSYIDRDARNRQSIIVEDITVQDLCDYIKVLRDENAKRKEEMMTMIYGRSFSTIEPRYIPKDIAKELNIKVEEPKEISKFELLDLT